jgi:hypothetical protein
MMVDESDISRGTVQKIFFQDLGEKRKGKKEKKFACALSQHTSTAEQNEN